MCYTIWLTAIRKHLSKKPAVSLQDFRNVSLCCATLSDWGRIQRGDKTESVSATELGNSLLAPPDPFPTLLCVPEQRVGDLCGYIHGLPGPLASAEPTGDQTAEESVSVPGTLPAGQMWQRPDPDQRCSPSSPATAPGITSPTLFLTPAEVWHPLHPSPVGLEAVRALSQALGCFATPCQLPGILSLPLLIASTPFLNYPICFLWDPDWCSCVLHIKVLILTPLDNN